MLASYSWLASYIQLASYIRVGQLHPGWPATSGLASYIRVGQLHPGWPATSGLASWPCMIVLSGISLSAAEPVALRLEGTLSGSSEIILEQGKSFGIHFACVDAKGEPAVLGG